MPNITEFNAGDLKLQPSNVGEEADVRSAYRVGALYRQAGMTVERDYDQAGRAIGTGVAEAGRAAVDYEDHREISKGSADGAQMLLDKENQWNDIAKTVDPNDPNAAAKFRDQQLEPALEDFQNQFHTQKSQEWATAYAERVRQHMDVKTAGDMSRLARIATQNNALQTANTLATTAYKDPSTLGTAFDLFDHSLEGKIGSNPNLSAEDAGTIREKFGYDAKKQMVGAAVHGAIANGGDWHHIADDPRYAPYINAGEAEQFDKVEKFYQRGAAVAQKQEMLLNRQIATANTHASLNDSWSKYVKIDPTTGRVAIDPKFVGDMVDLPTKNAKDPEAAATAKTYIDWTESQQKPEKATSDPLLLHSVDQQMFASDHQTTEMDIIRGEADGKISRQDGAARLSIIRERDAAPIKDPIFKAALDGAKSQIESTIPGVGRQGVDKFAGFMASFLTEYQRQSRAGTLPPNALDLNDPKSLISQKLAPYRNDLAGSISVMGASAHRQCRSTPRRQSPSHCRRWASAKPGTRTRHRAGR